MSESRNPIDKTGRANIHEVGAPRATIGIESGPLQEIFGEEGTEAGTIDEMIMRNAAGGGNSRFTFGLGVEMGHIRMHEWCWPTLWGPFGKGGLIHGYCKIFLLGRCRPVCITLYKFKGQGR